MMCLTICFLLIGCSYAMDRFEGLMTERSGFSINTDYKAGRLEISWSEEPSDKDFAGYEVYMIPEPWNEYGTYEVIAARYNLHPVHFFCNDIILMSRLGSRSTKYVSIPVLPSQLKGEGEYYVRVGIITMDQDSNTKNPYPVNEPNYKQHSSLESISGYKPVYIY